MRFLAQFNNVLVYVLLDRGLHQADAEPVARRLDHLRGRHPQFGCSASFRRAERRKALELDPQHALGGSARRARRRDAAHPGRRPRARRRRAARVRRQDPGRPAPHRRQEPAHRGGGADRRIRAGGEDGPSRSPRRRRSATARTWPSPARWSCRAAATGVVVATGSETELGRINQLLAEVSALETPLLRQIKKFGYTITAVIAVVSVAALLVGPLARAHDLRRAVPGGGRHRGVADSRGVAGADHDHARHRRAAHGEPQRDHPPPAGGRDLRLRLTHLLRQDRHADADGDDGDFGRDGGQGVRGQRRRLRARGRRQGRRRGARRDARNAHADGPRLDALQRRRALSGRGQMEGRGRSDRGRALSLRDQARHGPRRRRRRRRRASTRFPSNPSTSSWRR